MRRLLTKIYNADTELLEFFLDILTASWGVFLVLPFQTFTLSRGFNTLELVAPEWVTGLVFMTLGIAQIYFMARPEWGHHRVTTMIACFLWCFVAIGFLLANVKGVSTVVYPAIALAYIWVYGRMGVVKHTEV